MKTGIQKVCFILAVLLGFHKVILAQTDPFEVRIDSTFTVETLD
jgi:hypothetical protein